jgi:L-threonylcarbamoyladenylate synthase
MAELIDIEMEPDRALAEAARVLASGKPVAITTETVYGLAADATNPSAISRIYEVKGRPRFNPLIAHMASLEMALEHADFDPMSLRLAQAFWPGPLTLVLPLKPESRIHELCTAGLPTIGIRVPEGFAGRLISAYGKPLAAPSANLSGRISPTSAQHVAADLGDRIELILDGGSAGVGVESTIIKIEDGTVRLLRPGGLDVEAIERLLGKEVLRSDHAEAIEAPGMLASHYAPHAGVRLNVGEVRQGEVFVNFGGQHIAGADRATAAFDLSPTGDLREAAANLFAIMKKADALHAAAIAFAPVPMDNLGEAINDRLARAAAPRD